MSYSDSMEIIPVSHHGALQALKSLITTLQKYMKGRRSPNDHELCNLQESGEKLLAVLKDSSHATLYCANFIVTMMTFLPGSETYFNGPRIRSVLQALIDNVKYIDNSETHSAVELLWKSIVKVDLTLRFVEYSSDRFECLFPHLLLNVFNCLRHTNSPVLYNVMNAIGVKCLLKLAEYPTSKATHESLSIILMQLVEPYSHHSKLAAQGVLKRCGYNITGAIIQLLSPVLVRGGPIKNDHSICHFVYSAIYELLQIDQALVIGLINNTELCLNTGRLDRCTGVEFLASLFSGENIPGMSNPSQLFPHLWRRFSYHCQTRLTCKAEVMLVARFSTDFLVHQPDLAVVWCSVLRNCLLTSNDPECVRALTQSIANYFLHNFPLSHAIKSTEIDTLIKDLLRTVGPHKLPTQYRIIFIQQLASVYEKIVDDGSNISNRKRASAVLEYIYFLCDLFDPFNEDWYLLRNVFLNYLVPWDVDSNKRVKRFLLLFIITEPKFHLVLHQLFYRTIKVRRVLRDFLQHPPTLRQRCECSQFLNMFLVNAQMSQSCIEEQILHVAWAKPTVRELLTKVLDFNVTCTANKEACDDLKKLLVTQTKKEHEVIDSFLLYIAEPTFDASFFQVLVKEVNSYLLEDGDSLGMPESALQALDELLYIRPGLGFSTEFVNQLKGWIENATDGVLIRLMLRCFERMHGHLKLELWNPEYTQHELIPFWLQIVESGKREETKLAIQCLALHLQISSSSAFEKVLKIMDNQLRNPYNLELYEHGVSALGHVAKVSDSLSPAVREETNRLMKDRVIWNIYSQEEHWTKPTVHNPKCQWIPWRELNIGMRIQVQSLRTMGRYARYTSQKEEAQEVLRCLQQPLELDYDPTDCSKIDWDWIRLEAASAALHIWERKDVFMNRAFFMKLAHLLTDDTVMVRKLFAEKLRRGLTPHKVWDGKKGKSKGYLPPRALGLLALLGLNDETENFDQRFSVSHEVDDVVLDVIQSYRNQIGVLSCSLSDGKKRVARVCEISPRFVAEYALAYAVPVLAEHSALNSSQTYGPHSFDSFEFEEDAIVKAWKCFSFLSQRLGAPSKAVRAASKSFVMQMAKKARETIKPTYDEVKFKKSLILCDLLLLVAEHHSVWTMKPINPPVVLPKIFFNSEPLEDQRCQMGNLISENMKAMLLSSCTISEVESTHNSSENMKTEESESEEELSEGETSTSGTLSWGSLSNRNHVGAVQGKNHMGTESRSSASSIFNLTMASPSIPPSASSTPNAKRTMDQPSTSFQSKRTSDDEVFKKPHRKHTKK